MCFDRRIINHGLRYFFAARLFEECFREVIKHGEDEEGEEVVGEGSSTRDRGRKNEREDDDVVDQP